MTAAPFPVPHFLSSFQISLAGTVKLSVMVSTSFFHCATKTELSYALKFPLFAKKPSTKIFFINPTDFQYFTGANRM